MYIAPRHRFTRFRSAFAIIGVSIILSLSISHISHGMDVDKQKILRGFNLCGAEFGAAKPKAKIWFDYFWPSTKEVKELADFGVTILRVPFLWNRMQPELMKPLDKDELSRLDALVRDGANRKVFILLDPHSFGGHYGKMIGSIDVPSKAFADFWTRLASHYKNEPYVVFGLMNEPNKQSAKEWAVIAQEAVHAIRKVGAKQLILVPGTRWTGAHSWTSGNPSNADALVNLNDPLNNFAFELHQYFDDYSAGIKDTCVSETIGSDRLIKATQWLRKTGHRAFLAEFGASKNPTCLKALENILEYMNNNSDVWIGWSYWAASPWFGSYMFNVYPPNPDLFPQALILKNKIKN